MLNNLPTQRVLPALRFSLHEANLSHEKLAKRAGFSTSAISRRLSGETPTSLTELEQLANALGLEVTVTFTQKAEAAA